ncbi:unnamed protein product [Somion occarium]|uniref:Uncharacterized protein n=1 Tax=Somion occarium TaxID=3059160 RepID=A0ABP1DSU9_9APHY
MTSFMHKIKSKMSGGSRHNEHRLQKRNPYQVTKDEHSIESHPIKPYDPRDLTELAGPGFQFSERYPSRQTMQAHGRYVQKHRSASDDEASQPYDKPRNFHSDDFHPK